MKKELDEFEVFLVGVGEEFEKSEDALAAYNNLADKLNGKNYFVVSLCMDDIIFSSNLKKDKIVAPLGGYMKKQCPDACTHDLYEVSETVCPKCGKELIFNNILAENYVEEGYLPMWEKHKKWLTGTLNKKLCILELGASLRFPQIVRWPFEKICFLNEKAYFIRVNEKIPQLSADISGKGESYKQNSVEWLKML